MKKSAIILITLMLAIAMQAQDYTHGLIVWFDKPTTLNGRAVWYGGRPDLWKGKGKPERAGAVNYNYDAK